MKIDYRKIAKICTLIPLTYAIIFYPMKVYVFNHYSWYGLAAHIAYFIAIFIPIAMILAYIGFISSWLAIKNGQKCVVYLVLSLALTVIGVIILLLTPVAYFFVVGMVSKKKRNIDGESL